MLTRIDSFFSLLSVPESDREIGLSAARLAAERAGRMVHLKDYEALAAIALHYRPRRVFEIGTYVGTTSDFFLSMLPECEVVSIAFTNPRWRIPGRSYINRLLPVFRPAYNNSELSREQIGSQVASERRGRFTQLYGDSHRLDSRALLQSYGRFDLVFIDGDHSARGVSLDTELAKNITTESGVICWHDANPKPRYMSVRRYLEAELDLTAAATKADYVGGIAAWSREIEQRCSANKALGESARAM